MTRVKLDCSHQDPLTTEERHLNIIQELVEERDQLRAQLATATSRIAELEADARALWAWRTLAQLCAIRGIPLHMYEVQPGTYETSAIARARAVYGTLPEDVRRELGEMQ